MDMDSDMKIFTPKPAGRTQITQPPGEVPEPEIDIPIWQPHSAEPAQ